MAEEETDDSKRRWKSLRSKLLPRRQAENEVSGDDLSDFLRPSIRPHVTDTKRTVGPKLDTSAAAKWPKALDVIGLAAKDSPDSQPFHYSKPTRRPGLIVGFVEYAPEVIGFGGDEANEPANAVHWRARSVTSNRDASEAIDQRRGRSGTSPNFETNYRQQFVEKPQSTSPWRSGTTRVAAFQQGLRYGEGQREAQGVSDVDQSQDRAQRQRAGSSPNRSHVRVWQPGAQDSAQDNPEPFYTTSASQRAGLSAPKLELSLPQDGIRAPESEIAPRRDLLEMKVSEGRTFLSAAKASTRPGSSGSERSAASDSQDYFFSRNPAGSGPLSSSGTPSPTARQRYGSNPRLPQFPPYPHTRVSPIGQAFINPASPSPSSDGSRPPSSDSQSHRVFQHSQARQYLPSQTLSFRSAPAPTQRQRAESLQPPDARYSPQPGSPRSPSPAARRNNDQELRDTYSNRDGDAPPDRPPQGQLLEFRCTLKYFEISATDRTTFASGSSIFSPPWHHLHIANIQNPDAGSPGESQGPALVVFDDQGSFSDFNIQKQRYRLSAARPDVLTVLVEPGADRKVRQRTGYTDPEMDRHLDRVAEILKQRRTLQTYDFANIGNLHLFIQATSGYEVKHDSPVQVSVPRARTVLAPNKVFQPFAGRVQLLKGRRGHRLNAFLDDGRALGIEMKAWDAFESMETKDGSPAVRLVDAKFSMAAAEDAGAGFLNIDTDGLTDHHDDVLLAFPDERGREAFARELPGPLTQPKGFTLMRRI